MNSPPPKTSSLPPCHLHKVPNAQRTELDRGHLWRWRSSDILQISRLNTQRLGPGNILRIENLISTQGFYGPFWGFFRYPNFEKETHIYIYISASLHSKYHWLHTSFFVTPPWMKTNKQPVGRFEKLADRTWTSQHLPDVYRKCK